MVSNLVKELKVAISKNNFLNSGKYFQTWIYLVDEWVIGKKCRRNDVAQNEYNWGNYVFERGVQVPEMYQLISPSEIGEMSVDWIILMQKIDGKDLRKLNGVEKEEALKLRKIELEKVLELGVYPEDSLFAGNSIFDQEQEKLYLIDFEFWRKGTSEELNCFYRKLR